MNMSFRSSKFSGQLMAAETVSSGGEESPDPLVVTVSEAKPKIRVPWSIGLFDCFSDCRLCCMTCWCPCVTFGRIAEIVDKGSSSCGVNGALYALVACVTGCACCYSCFYRSKMRQQLMLKEANPPCCDCCVHFFCECCALCQEYRELTARGYDLPIGWHGNLENRTRAQFAFPQDQSMSKI